GKFCGEPIERAAHFIELADALGIELGDFKAAAAAFGEQALPVQQMQRVRHRLARHAELVRKLVLGDALSGKQGAIDDGLENPRKNLFGQIGGGFQRDHSPVLLEYGIPYSEYYLILSGRSRGGRQGASNMTRRVGAVIALKSPARSRNIFAVSARTSG